MIVRSIGNVLYQPKVVNLRVCHFGKWEIQDQERIYMQLKTITKLTESWDQFIRDTIVESKMATNSGVSNRQRLSGNSIKVCS